MQIAVCDDNPEELAQVTALLEAYVQARPGLDGQVASFRSGLALLTDAEARGGFDLYVLDIIMPSLSGIETAKKLRELGDGGEILYLTASNDYAADSYDVRAFFYLLKPVERERLYQVLDRAVEKLRRRREESILISTREGLRRFPLDRILYAERAGRVMRLHCVDGVVDSVSLRASFRETAAPLLADPRFCLCGVSFVLNLRRVVGVEAQAALLDNGERVALPRAATPAFKEAWGRFWLDGGWKW